MKKLLIQLLILFFSLPLTGLQAQNDRPFNKDKDGPPRKTKGLYYLKNRNQVDTPWENEADLDRNGLISENELRAYVTMLEQQEKGEKGPLNKDRPEVEEPVRPADRVEKKMKPIPASASIERRYDLNEDGMLNLEETRLLVKDRLDLFEKHKVLIVTGSIEKHFDENKDGRLNRKECEKMKFVVLGLGKDLD